MTRILFVRHGQSEWNAEGKWQGQADIALSDLGRRQAHAAAKKLGSFDLIAASTLVRASETAYILSQALGIGPILPVPDLVERSAGEWSGLTRGDIERDWPGYLADEKRPPGYESDEDLLPRLYSGLQTVVNNMPDKEAEALVVAHGGLIYLLETTHNRKAGRIPNLGALWLDVEPDGTVHVGERAHLIDERELASEQSSDIL